MTGIPSDPAIISLAANIGTGIAVKATLVLALAGLLVYVFRQASAAYKCAIWSTALAALLVLPVLSLIIPSWEIKQIELLEPSKPASATAAGPVSTSPMDSPSGLLAPDANADEAGKPKVTGSVGVRQESSIASGTELAASMLLVIWLAGIVVLLLRLGMHALQVRRIIRSASAIDDADVSEMTAEAVRTFGISRPVQVVCSDEVSMPFTCGLWKSTVVLPAFATGWPLGRMHSVLLHELAHAARWDYIIHLLVEFTCTLHWPNPAVWCAARRAAMERERACDDCALRYGTPSDVYASELLQIARSQVKGPAPAPAITMAGKADLAGRVRNIMGARIDRSPIRLGTLLLITYVTVVLTLPLALVDALGIQSLARPTEDIPTTKQLIRDLRDADDPLVRRMAAWWLGEHEDGRGVQPLIEDGLSDGSADVRLVSAWALGEIKDDDAIYPLISALEDHDPLVREMAALALGEIENPLAVDALVETFDQDEDLRGPVIWALGEIRGERADKARRAAFAQWRRRPWENDEVWTGRLKTKSFTVFGRTNRGTDCREELGTLLSELASRDSDERLDAAFGIGRLGIYGCRESTLAVKPLLETLRDPSPEVRAMAVWALDEINPSRWNRSHHDRRKDY